MCTAPRIVSFDACKIFETSYVQNRIMYKIGHVFTNGKAEKIGVVNFKLLVYYACLDSNNFKIFDTYTLVSSAQC